MNTYCSHSGTKIDVAVCSHCEQKEVFDKPRELSCVIGTVENSWRCILEDLENPNSTEVVCPDCEPESTGWTYILK